MPPTFWQKIIWSDESKFQLQSNGRIVWVWRKKNEAFKKDNTVGTVKHSPHIMVWGCFTGHGLGHLTEVSGRMNAYQYRDILIANLQSSAEEMGIRDNFIFQHDNDPKHTSKLVKSYLDDAKVEVLQWPAQSPDLNPIEHLWDELDRTIPKKRRKSLKDFKSAIFESWSSI